MHRGTLSGVGCGWQCPTMVMPILEHTMSHEVLDWGHLWSKPF